jgi:hypothetical protein
MLWFKERTRNTSSKRESSGHFWSLVLVSSPTFLVSPALLGAPCDRFRPSFAHIMHIYIYISIYLFIHLYLSILSNPLLSIPILSYLSYYPTICLSIYLSIFLSVFLSIYLSIFLSFYLSIHPSMYLSIYRSIYLSIYILFVIIHISLLSLLLCLHLGVASLWSSAI